MEQALIKTVKTNITEMDDLDSISTLIQNHIQVENSNVEQVIHRKLNERPGLIGVIWPNRIQREYDELTVQQMRDLFKHRQEIVSLFINIQLELARRAGEKLILQRTQQYERELIKQAIDIRAELTAVCQTNLNDISVVFHKSRKEFVERIKIQEAEAEQCKDVTFLYDEYKESIRHETIIFFQIIKDHLDKFRAALNISLQEALNRFSNDSL